MAKSIIQYPSDIHDYIISVSLRENDILRNLRMETDKHPLSIMQIPPEQGQFLAFLVKILQADNVLEIGTYFGYSALWFALALPKDGRLVTCDINQQWAKIGKKYWEQARVAHKIDFRLGDASQTLDSLLGDGKSETFDFVFIDGDSISYDEYYEKSLKLLRPGGVIAIDNILLLGTVVDSRYTAAYNLLSSKKDANAKVQSDDIITLQKLNQKIKSDKRVDVSILPISDGISLIRKK